jgi:cyclase
MGYIRWLIFCCVSIVGFSAFSVGADEVFDIKPVAQGVYAAIAKPSFRTNSNSAIVLLDDGVLVVDTQSKPSAAQALITEIKQITNKPVKYVVLTHFHGDHTQGVEAYTKAWPAVEVIATSATRDSIAQRGKARLEREFVTVPQQIEKFKKDLQNATDQAEKAQIKKTLTQAEDYLTEAKQIHLVPPALIVDDNLNLARKAGVVKILALGKAHTDGDLVVYLPVEKVLITGDLVHGIQPITKDGYFSEWIAAIDKAEKLDFNSVIGGHGGVLEGKAAFELWKQYFVDLLAESSQSYGAGDSLDAARKRLVPVLSEKYAGKFPKRFSETVVSDIEKAYRVVSGATE